MDAPVDPPASATDPAAKRAQQLRQIRSGCGGCFVFVLAVALFAGGFAVLKQWLRCGALGGAQPDLLVIAQPEKHANAIVWIGAFTLMIAVFALSARSAVRAIVQALIVVALGIAAIAWVSCGRFEALRPAGENAVELVYLWPRPNVRLDPRAVVIRQESEVTEIGDVPTSVDYLELEVNGARHRSASSGSVAAPKRFLLDRGARMAR